MTRYIRYLGTNDWFDTTKKSCSDLFGYDNYDYLVIKRDLKDCIVSDEIFYKGILQVGDLVEVVDEDNNLKEIIELKKFDIDDLQKDPFPTFYGKDLDEYTINEINRIFVKQTIQGRTAYVEVWNKEKGVL